MGWSAGKIIPASCAHLDFRELEAALIKAYGNVTLTAKALGSRPGICESWFGVRDWPTRCLSKPSRSRTGPSK